MKNKDILAIAVTMVLPAVLTSIALAAQDRYTVKVPARARAVRVQGLRRLAERGGQPGQGWHKSRRGKSSDDKRI
jgi:hypothetical protein